MKDEILRPRTAYNFFYRYQRDLILKSKANSSESKEGDKIPSVISNPITWSGDTARRKRPHRKTHGLIGLQQLTKTVAKRWKEADTETKNKFIALAAQDKVRYRNESLSRTKVLLHPYHHNMNDGIGMQCQQNVVLLRNNEFPHFERKPECFPHEVESNMNINSYPYRYGGYHGDRSLCEPIDYKKRSEIMPVFQSNNECIPDQTISQDNHLSAEEYDMLELLIRP